MKNSMIQSQNKDMLRFRIDDLLSLQIINKRYNLRLYSFDFEIGGVIVCRIGSRWKYRFENELEIKIGQIYQMVCLECFNNKLLSINSKLIRKHYRDIWKLRTNTNFQLTIWWTSQLIMWVSDWIGFNLRKSKLWFRHFNYQLNLKILEQQ